jgi:phosphoribosylglycinamide formyltransferase-1
MARIGGKILGGNVKITAAVFASGNGSNAENILRFALRHPDKVSIPLLICNKEGAVVIDRARSLGVPCAVVPLVRDGFPTYNDARIAQEKNIIKLLKEHHVEWALLAGYMQIISPLFLEHFFDKTLGVNRVVNIHPSLLPAFPGKDGYGDAWRAGVGESGVTLHFVDDGIDTGPIIAQKPFPRHADDTLEIFRARGLALEYEIYTEFLENLTAGEKTWARQ